MKKRKLFSKLFKRNKNKENKIGYLNINFHKQIQYILYYFIRKCNIVDNHSLFMIKYHSNIIKSYLYDILYINNTKTYIILNNNDELITFDDNNIKTNSLIFTEFKEYYISRNEYKLHEFNIMEENKNNIIYTIKSNNNNINNATKWIDMFPFCLELQTGPFEQHF